jgi:hypothetical protein
MILFNELNKSIFTLSVDILVTVVVVFCFLFFVGETFSAFPCLMARFLTIATRSGIAVSGRAGLSFALPFCFALRTVRFAFAFALISSIALLAFVRLAVSIVLMLTLSSATVAVAVSPPIHDGGRVVGEGRLVFGVDKLSDLKIRVALETLVCE